MPRFAQNVYDLDKGSHKAIVSCHPETAIMGVILRSKATKNLIVTGSAKILRFAQNDMQAFPDEN